MDDLDPAALARKFVSAQDNTQPLPATPQAKPEDTPLITSDSPLNLRPSQVPTPPKPPAPAPEPAPEPTINGPSIASLSAPTPGFPESSPLITNTQVSPEQPQKKVKPPKPPKRKNVPLIILFSVLGGFIVCFLGYFVYFYYLSDSFTGAPETAVTPSETPETPEDPLTPSDASPTDTPADTPAAAPADPSDVPAEPTEPVTPPSTATPVDPKADEDKLFSRLSGEEISDLSKDSAPTFCVQIPNGVDGGRPQVGLSSAKVVFEAIAESGITRFSAVFQNPPTVVGPIRSLRIYYLNWDTPFDCIVTHAGGADDALSALRSNNYRELDESTDYMFRDSSDPARLWNNLFATGPALSSFAQNMGYLSSDIKSFPRLTPAKAEIAKILAQAAHPLVIDQPADEDTSELKPTITKISFKFGDMPTFNPVYTYNPTTNSYLRAYESGSVHTALDCSSLDATSALIAVPTPSCQEVQLSPSVVIAMIVQESRAAYDDYHESISSIGAGDAYIFQNGGVLIGTWEKSSAGEQIIFRDQNNQEISLVPGQTWISAIPAYGAVSFE